MKNKVKKNTKTKKVISKILDGICGFYVAN